MFFFYAIIAAAILFCGSASACTPVATIAFLLVGSSGYGAVMSMGIGHPAAAIAMLLLAIAIKAALYARYAGYGKKRAVFDMLWANVISSIAGFMIAMVVATSLMTLFGIIFMCLILGTIAARSFAKDTALMNPWLMSLLMCIAMFFSFFLLLAAETVHPNTVSESGIDASVFFAVKTLGIFFGLLATISISLVLEGASIFRSHRKDESFPRKKALHAVLRANVYMFLILSLIGAVFALPHRWASPNFIWIPQDARPAQN